MDVGRVLFECVSAERLDAWRAFFAAEEEGWAAASARAGVGEGSGTAYALEHQEVYTRFVALVEAQLESLLAPHGATMRSLFETLQAARACHAEPGHALPPPPCAARARGAADHAAAVARRRGLQPDCRRRRGVRHPRVHAPRV